MPPTGANAKVKDPEYCNWLKVGLALFYLKTGLSSFIEDEVDAMQKFILQKLYHASTVPAPLCSSCNAKDVKQNRNVYTWKFKSPCPISLCDTWLTELLAFCTNPRSSKLYCENCDVTAWPKSPWECAKFYMPRGQTVHNTGPAQSDSQALLTLMANCKHFHSKLSPGGIQLTHTVSKIRNTVMHSGDMRLSDNERTSFITDIIKFLEDPCHLKSLDESKKAVAEINKLDDRANLSFIWHKVTAHADLTNVSSSISENDSDLLPWCYHHNISTSISNMVNTDSLEVFFSTDMEMEMKALSECVKDFRQELGVHMVETERTVESLKEEHNNLLKQIKEMKDQVGDIDTKCQKIGAKVNKLSRTVTNVKGQVTTQSATVKKTDNLLRRKVLPGLSQHKKKVRKLEKEMQLIKEHDSQASGATAGQVSEMNMESGMKYTCYWQYEMFQC